MYRRIRFYSQIRVNLFSGVFSAYIQVLIVERTRMNLLSLIFLTIFSLPSKSQNCGQFTFNAGLIVNGDATTRGEFPFLVALLMLREQSFFCAANLISQRHAVTGRSSFFFIFFASID